MRPGLGVGLLRGEERVAEPLVPPARELGHERAVVLVRRAVERAGRDGEKPAIAPRPSAFSSDSGERVEGRGHEVAVQAVHRHEQRLARLRLQARRVPGVPDVLARPHRRAAVADVAQEAQAPR